jgi:hypothetical protein
MWQGYQGSTDTKYLKGIIFSAGFVIGVAGILTLFWKYTTLSGEDMVDRTNLLI